MNKPTVAFDVDGTLIDKDDNPREDVIEMMKGMADFCDIYVWSGGGVPYSETWGRRLGLPDGIQYVRKASFYPDIAVDDSEDFILAKVVIHVGAPL